ncbi:uncharacterized protein BX664DRAFT_319989 [Halteromyces radiatus]|uniref:uncharacterized protein n=1 Tax=Halteromyces radiatus TaxID=101107 RepID=UPI0022210A17|nr:uncharacterized protein BX664DRAFT_319989 [Halteromyces radiatus]KAI8098952.1 hypothetical protein BX664DRAFT_319989 [Halteromyces radiatus]
MVPQLDDIDDNSLKTALTQLIQEYAKAGPTIAQLIDYYRAKLHNTPAATNDGNKKRKLIPDSMNIDSQDEQRTKIPDLSFQLPARKKYTLVLTKSFLQLVNEKTHMVEYSIATSDFEIACIIPTPEKPIGSFTAALFSQRSDPFVLSLPDKGALTILNNNEEQTITSPIDKKKVLVDLLLTYQVVTPAQLAEPSNQFYVCSGVSPSTGKPDTDRTFVKTYLRNKDGVLYFLPQGVLFGFKKPTMFIPNTMIAATVITNVTKHTFDLALQLLPDHYPLGAADAISWTPFLQEIAQRQTVYLPFSMIEQSDYAGIEGYIKKVGINDRSMTEATKAPEPIKSSKEQYKQECDDDDNDEERQAIQNNDDDDDDADVDFMPNNNNSDDEDPLEYDSDASLDDEDNNGDDDDDHQSASPMDDDQDDEVDLLDEDSE